MHPSREKNDATGWRNPADTEADGGIKDDYYTTSIEDEEDEEPMTNEAENLGISLLPRIYSNQKVSPKGGNKMRDHGKKHR